MHFRLEADDADIVPGRPHPCGIGFEYRLTVGRILTDQSVGKRLAAIDRQRRARLIAPLHRRPGALRGMDTRAPRFGHPGRQRHGGHRLSGSDILRDPFRHVLPPGRLPDLERSLVPAETPADGQVEVARIVGDRLKMHCAVMQHVAERGPHEPGLGVRTGPQLRKTLGQVPVLENCGNRLVGLARGRTIVALRRIQHLNFLAGLAIDAPAGFLTERLLFQQALQPVRRLVVLVPGIVRQGLLHRVDDVGERVEADHVGRAISRAFRAADQRARQGIHFVETQAELPGMVERRKDGKYPDAVGDEIGRVLGADHALAQGGDEEFLQLVQDGGLGLAAGNQFHQVHVARRIEEMNAAEARSGMHGHRARERIYSQARGVTGKDGVFAKMRRHFLVQVLLPVHALGNRLDDDVAFLEQMQVLFVIRRLDEFGFRCHRQRTGFQLFQAVDRLADVAVRVTLLCGQLEQNGLDVGIDQVRRDLRSHHAGTENRDFAYEKWRRMACHEGSSNEAAAGDWLAGVGTRSGGLAPAARFAL